ncbi:hypothetical protein PN836_005650 [Ningiella sp. W23]|uniref:hypothetical protein n=1 Tax=Ningiella sp. W23 TaxID=3023715 RepID=UPI0037565A51
MKRGALTTIVFILATQKCFAMDIEYYTYVDSTATQYQFPNSYDSFNTESLSRAITKCHEPDCILVGETMLFKPPIDALTGSQQIFEFGGKSFFIKPTQIKLISKELEVLSITGSDEHGDYTYLYHKDRGVIAFELRLEIINYKSREPFLSRYFLILSGGKGIFSSQE